MMRSLLLLLVLFSYFFLVAPTDLISGRKGLWTSPFVCSAIALIIGFMAGYWQRGVVHSRNEKRFQNHGEALLANQSPVAVLNHNKPAAYLISAATYEDMLEQLEDAALTKIVKARAGGKTVKVNLEDL